MVDEVTVAREVKGPVEIVDASGSGAFPRVAFAADFVRRIGLEKLVRL